MICNPSTSQFKAVIDTADSMTCKNTQDYTTNTCRNIVTLNEILNGTGSYVFDDFDARTSTDSASIREQCMQEAIGTDEYGKVAIRTWLETEWQNMQYAENAKD
jgi:hypothetical protein